MCANKTDHSSCALEPAAYTAEDLACDLGLTYPALARAAARITTHGYSQFARRVGRKARVISEPAPWLMRIQRDLVDRVLSRLEVSERVFSTKGRDTIKHAGEHVGRAYLVVMDIRDCYPSVLLEVVRCAFLKVGFSHHVAMLLSRLVTHNGRLPQGAPSSAAVLDCVLRDIDNEFSLLAAREGAVYSRYADDLCFSGPKPLTELRRRAARSLSRLGLRISATKTRSWGPGEMKFVTKIVVADRLYASPSYLRTLDAAIRVYSASGTPANAKSITSQIGWVMRLNEAQGEHYRDRFNRAQRDRRTRKTVRQKCHPDGVTPES